MSHHIYIVESPNAEEVKTGRQEGTTLKAALAHAGISAEHEPVQDHVTFAIALGKIVARHQLLGKGGVPVLHLSMHGNETGVGFTEGPPMGWDLLGACLGIVNGALGGGVHVAMSTCRGFSGIEMAWRTSSVPFDRLIGPKEDVFWEDTVAAFVALYHFVAARGGSVDEGVDVMNHVLNRVNNPLFAHADGRQKQAEFLGEVRRIENRLDTLNRIRQVIDTTNSPSIKERMHRLATAFEA